MRYLAALEQGCPRVRMGLSGSAWAFLVHYVRVQHAVLLQIVRDGVLRQQRRFQLDLRANPLPFGMRQVGGMFAGPTRSEFRTESGTLNFVKLAQVAPGLVSDGAGYVDLEFYNCHYEIPPRRHRDTENTFPFFAASITG